MMFLDTSAIYALADQDDPNHRSVEDAFERLLGNGEDFMLHSYVLVEAIALLQRQLGLALALQLRQQSESFSVHWITQEDHERSVRLLEERGRRNLSLVDCASFVIMRDYQLTRAFALDADFEREGFEVYPG